jgi:Flp pilus assembly protein TadG
MKSESGLLPRWRRQRGATVIFIAVGMVMLLAFTALAIDIGYVLVVRNELQNDADAAALAGARDLFPANPKPNWTAAEAKATATIPLNKATNVALANGAVQSGFWNLTGTPAGLQSKTITPGVNDAAAVMVTVSKSAGNNGGPVSLFFGPVFGINTMSVAASAVAVVSFPGSVGQGQLFPVAIAKCLYDNFWDSNANPPGPKIDPSTKQPYEFKIGSAYHYPPCDSGEWTSFQFDANDTPTIRDLIANGNPTPLSIGDDIWIEPGTKTAIYKDVPVGTTVLLPVVPCVTCGKGEQPIKAFGPFVIDAAVGGSGKYVQGHFTTNFKVGVGSGGGPNYGAFTPPSLAR